jgi:hypothetical protein
MALPYLAADAHRARLLSTELPAQGWDVELLVPGDAFQLREHFEPGARHLSWNTLVHRAEPKWTGLFRALGTRSVGWRAYGPLRATGDRVLSGGRFDLIYFSCSQPPLFHLGVRWRRRFHVPFILDFHDPWYAPQPVRTKHVPVGKQRISNSLARFLERATVEAASGLVAVSQKYLEALNERYLSHDWPALRPDRQVVIPFAASDADYEAARHLPRRPVTGASGSRTIVYTGAGGAIMERSFRAVCRLLNEARRRSPERLSGLHIHLFGTEPLAGGSPVLTEVIRQEGVSDIVTEHPARLSYLEALRLVTDADGLLILGVNDPAYMPSKLFLYGLTGKPILACLHPDSVVNEYFARARDLGRLIPFERKPDDLHDDRASMHAFLDDVTNQRTTDRRAMLAEWLAPAMARRHAELFDACL